MFVFDALLKVVCCLFAHLPYYKNEQFVNLCTDDLLNKRAVRLSQDFAICRKVRKFHRIDVAALQRILSVFWEFQQHLYDLAIPLGMTSAEFGGKLKLARLRLCPYVDDRAILSACFTNEWSGTEYALDIGQYLPVAVDRNLACYLAQLRQSPA